LIEGTMLVGLHTTWSAPQAKNPSYAPGLMVWHVEPASSCKRGISGIRVRNHDFHANRILFLVL